MLSSQKSNSLFFHRFRKVLFLLMVCNFTWRRKEEKINKSKRRKRNKRERGDVICMKSIFKTTIDQKGSQTQNLLTIFHLFYSVSIFIISSTGKYQVSFTIWHGACCNTDDVISVVIMLPCYHCGYYFISFNKLLEHLRWFQSLNSYSCQICRTYFS